MNNAQPIQRTFHNHTAGFLWGFAMVFTAILILITVACFSKPLPPGHTPGLLAAIMGVFWLAGAGLVWFVSQVPLIDVEILDRFVVIKKRTVFKCVSERINIGQVSAKLIQRQDGDGDAYFRCILEGLGEEVAFYESASKQSAQEKLDEFLNSVKRVRSLDP